LKGIIAGSALSFALTFVFVFIIALLEYFTGMSEGAANICAYIAAAAGVFAGALLSAAVSGQRALLNAMPVSLIYIAAIITATLIFRKSINTDIHCISLFAGIVLAGFLGAVAGQRK